MIDKNSVCKHGDSHVGAHTCDGCCIATKRPEPRVVVFAINNRLADYIKKSKKGDYVFVEDIHKVLKEMWNEFMEVER